MKPGFDARCPHTVESVCARRATQEKPYMEQLESFGLPPTFPAHMMPDRGARFVADCPKGISKAALVRLARERGFMPTWKRLKRLGPCVYGLGLTIDGCAVPLMVRMKAVEDATAAVVVQPEQQLLF
jgi:hypothetical protein